MLVLFLIVMGGIYVGWFTPTEAAGIGAMGAFVDRTCAEDAYLAG